MLAGKPGGFKRQLKKNCGLSIRKSDGLAAPMNRAADNFFRGAFSPHDPPVVVRGHLRDIGILAESAPEIAPDSSQGIRQCAGIKMKQRLFLNGINVDRYHAVINKRLEDSVSVFPHIANAAGPLPDEAPVIAEFAVELLIGQLFIEQRFHDTSPKNYE
jgi:hypothetical protein